MGDSSAKRKPASIPDWQKNYVQTSTPTQDQSSTSDDAPSSILTLLDQATRWLEEDTIRDASREQKVAFLEQKGLQNDDIQKLLSASDTPVEDATVKTIHDSASGLRTTKTSIPSEKPISTTPSPQTTTISPVRDVPPIITYPEFLLRPEKPPPLVTFQRLAYAAYGLAGLTALTYGTSKYLIQPMLESLTSARHDLADTTIQNLQKLNSKLEANVSHVPYMSSSALLKHKGEESYVEDDAETVDSDPTELFHRDIATQTSLHPSRATSMSSSTSLGLHRDANQTTSQETRLSTIHSSLSSILNDTSSTSPATASTESLKSSVENLQSYLDNLQYSNNSIYTNYDHILSGTEAQKTAGKKRDPDDEADKFKAEIRAVKGALLSSRNFPTGGRPGASAGGHGMYGMVAGR